MNWMKHILYVVWDGVLVSLLSVVLLPCVIIYLILDRALLLFGYGFVGIEGETKLVIVNLRALQSFQISVHGYTHGVEYVPLQKHHYGPLSTFQFITMRPREYEEYCIYVINKRVDNFVDKL